MPKRKKPSSRPLQEKIVLRYRGDGHLRFQIPPELRVPAMAEALEEGLTAVDGVYRAVVYRRAGKLSIRYMDTVLTSGQVALAFVDVLDDLVANPPEAEKPSNLRERVEGWSPVRRAKAKYEDWKGKAQVVGALVAVKSGLPAKVPFDVESNVINFLNDLVAFYLIKTHWTQITQLWLRSPIRYRYQWLTMVYLVFLMVRYRKSMQARTAAKKKAGKKKDA